MPTRYGHTNLIARDWRRLASFYEDLFGCVPVPPERDYRGEALEQGTGVRNAALHGIHLRLPGHGPDGPTLEIYEYACRRLPTGQGGDISPLRWTTSLLCRRQWWRRAARASARS